MLSLKLEYVCYCCRYFFPISVEPLFQAVTLLQDD